MYVCMYVCMDAAAHNPNSYNNYGGGGRGEAGGGWHDGGLSCMYVCTCVYVHVCMRVYNYGQYKEEGGVVKQEAVMSLWGIESYIMFD